MHRAGLRGGTRRLWLPAVRGQLPERVRTLRMRLAHRHRQTLPACNATRSSAQGRPTERDSTRSNWSRRLSAGTPGDRMGRVSAGGRRPPPPPSNRGEARSAESGPRTAPARSQCDELGGPRHLHRRRRRGESGVRLPRGPRRSRRSRATDGCARRCARCSIALVTAIQARSCGAFGTYSKRSWTLTGPASQTSASTPQRADVEGPRYGPSINCSCSTTSARAGRPLLQKLSTSEHDEISWRASAAIRRLDKQAPNGRRS